MKREFVLFSNTTEEYEAFINAKTFYWPRSISSKTPYQRENNIDNLSEEIGDAICIVVGASVKQNIKDSYLKERINTSPMLTHRGKVSKIVKHPALGYRYTHGNDPNMSFMLPMEFFDELIKQETYLGEPFTKENIEELEKVKEMGKIITRLLSERKIKFVRAYYKGDQIFIQTSKYNKLFKLDEQMSEVTFEEADVSDKLTYREMPDKDSFLKIKEECNKAGLDGDSLIQNIRTWRGTEYIKIDIEEELYEPIEGRLNQGISTRLILDEDNSNDLVKEIKKKNKDIFLEDVIKSDIQAEIEEEGQEQEGRTKYYYGKRYERNPKNRKAAIKIHGVICKACNFNFEEVYGERGKDFIEVHHINPLSTLEKEVKINPETDLVPLCANCHRMVHRKIDNILSVESLKKILNSRN